MASRKVYKTLRITPDAHRLLELYAYKLAHDTGKRVSLDAAFARILNTHQELIPGTLEDSDPRELKADAAA